MKSLKMSNRRNASKKVGNHCTKVLQSIYFAY